MGLEERVGIMPRLSERKDRPEDDKKREPQKTTEVVGIIRESASCRSE